MKCRAVDCQSGGAFIPVLCLGSFFTPKEYRQPFPGLTVCERHQGWSREQLLSEPWFSGYAGLVARRHRETGFSLALSRVRFVAVAPIAEAL
jgi:hypothetical protein